MQIFSQQNGHLMMKILKCVPTTGILAATHAL